MPVFNTTVTKDQMKEITYARCAECFMFLPIIICTWAPAFGVRACPLDSNPLYPIIAPMNLKYYIMYNCIWCLVNVIIRIAAILSDLPPLNETISKIKAFIICIVESIWIALGVLILTQTDESTCDDRIYGIGLFETAGMGCFIVVLMGLNAVCTIATISW